MAIYLHHFSIKVFHAMETIANFFFQFGHLFFIVVLPDVGVKFSLFARIHTERCHSLLHVKSLQSRKYLRNPLLSV